MQLLAFLPVLHRARLDRVVGAQHVLSYRDLARRLAKGGVDVIILDPSVCDESEFREVTQALAETDAAVVVYTKLKSLSAARIVALANRRDIEVVLADVEDEVAALARVMAELPRVSLAARVLARVSPVLTDLPPPVIACIIGELMNPAGVSSKTLARQCAISRRTIDRHLKQAKLAPLHDWTVIARLARALESLHDEPRRWTAAVERSGYQTSRSLRIQFERLADSSLTQSRSPITEAEFLTAAAKRLLSRPA